MVWLLFVVAGVGEVQLLGTVSFQPCCKVLAVNTGP